MLTVTGTVMITVYAQHDRILCRLYEWIPVNPVVGYCDWYIPPFVEKETESRVDRTWMNCLKNAFMQKYWERMSLIKETAADGSCSFTMKQ